ncbi:CHAT domain-containing protein [Dactylosporangium sp. NBC_01737]|uniref:CHAT domain-containing protein n=1 Tax=Dactylosporangium sp. NBC_01737 TaxID=2975959 RepID=UPI002E0E02B9|nr:CHAT domain-containing protein [Dactylosporangium sp. NBC_01737]
MSRVVIAVGPGVDGQLCFTLRRAPNPPQDRQPRPFTCVVQDLPNGRPPPAPKGWVSRYGQRLWTELAQNPEVLQALQRVGGPRTVMFELQDQRTELFNWEMLCDDSGNFLALDSRPVGRIADQGRDQDSAVPQFTGTLRVTAVLSALGVPAGQEWTGVYAAVRAARERRIRVQLRVFVGEDDLYTTIEEAAKTDRDLSVALVPESAVDLRAAIREGEPHILHFFCHGAADLGQPRLQIAAPQDFERRAAGQPVGPGVVLEVGGLDAHRTLLGVWLVVLNCCEGGLAVQDVHSLANSLVAAGLPAAVGMRETIQAHAANEFSRVFYRELLTELIRLLRQPDGGEDVDIDWARLLIEPRAALVEQAQDATTSGVWTLPVLYTRFEPFRIRIPRLIERGGPSAQDRVTAGVLDGLVRRLPPDTPPEAVAELRRLAAEQLGEPA